MPGMLHPRYSNLLHCLYTIRLEEGMRGYFKGLPPYLLATAITYSVVPIVSELMLHSSKLYGKETFSSLDDLREEVEQNRK